MKGRLLKRFLSLTLTLSMLMSSVQPAIYAAQQDAQEEAFIEAQEEALEEELRDMVGDEDYPDGVIEFAKTLNEVDEDGDEIDVEYFFQSLFWCCPETRLCEMSY